MNTWTPLFSKIVDSSIWAEPDFVVKVFLTMLALKDADQVVRYNAFAIARKCWPSDGGGEAKVLDALKVLSSRDKRRIEKQPFDGRRIERVEDGWLLLNGQFYEDMMRGLNRRAYKAAKQREYREREKAKTRIRAENDGRESRYVKADANGDKTTSDRIASEGL